jgi:Xaa-Pro dipeptidase
VKLTCISPCSYFCQEYIKAYFLDNELHAKYINKKVLDKYWDVGGVRIEDDILVTEGGYENLTVAPKGEEMLKIINAGGGDSC